MILKKEIREGQGTSSANILGLKVIGGQVLEVGRVGAVVEKVKKGSIADQIGRLRPGDEVIEWNGRYLITLQFSYLVILEILMGYCNDFMTHNS